MDQNQQTKRKKIIVIALMLLTILLGATAVGMAYYIQQNQSPDDSSADAVGCDTATDCVPVEVSGSIKCTKNGSVLSCCPANTKFDNATRSCLAYCNVKTNNCLPFPTSLSGSSKCVFGSVYYNCCPGSQVISNGKCEDAKTSENTCPAGTTINSGKTACVCDNNSSLTFPVGTVTAVCTTTCSQVGGTCQSTACTSGQSVAYGACAGGGFCCTGTPNNGNGNGNVDNGNETPGGQTGGSCGSGGTCFQQGGTFNGVTVNNCGSLGRVDSSPNSCGAGFLCCALSGGGGTSTPSTNIPSKSQCGGSCTTNSDCAASATGVAVVCRNNVCENATCAAGKTVPGANCECSNLNACGQACSASLGLCQSGSECGFIGSPNSCVQNEGKNNGTQFCVPTNPSKGYTLTACTGIAALNLRSPLGTDVTTQAQVLEACNLITQTSGIGNSGGSSATSVCGDAVCATNENSFTCPGDCKLPDTAIVSERTDKVILGILVILLGVSLAGGFDRLKRARA